MRAGSRGGIEGWQPNAPSKAKRILVVEDEPMIRMLLEDMLGELGYTVAAEAARIEEALEAMKNVDFDLAILDADLNGQPALPVADALVTRGTPFVFATGYGEVPEPYRGRPRRKEGPRASTWQVPRRAIPDERSRRRSPHRRSYRQGGSLGRHSHRDAACGDPLVGRSGIRGRSQSAEMKAGRVPTRDIAPKI